MKMRYFVIGLIVFFVGVGVCLYPLIQDKYTSYKQEKMVEQVRDEIYNQIMNNNAKPTSAPEDNAEDNSGNVEDEDNNDEQKQQDVIEVEQHDDIQYIESDIDSLKGQKIIGIVEIDKLDVTYPIVEGTNKDNLHVAIGHMVKTSGIGKEGNCVIAGHRGGALGEFFKRLDLLDEGDVIKLVDLSGTPHLYEVYDSFVVEPTRMDVTYNNDPYEKTITLITCEANGTKRLIVKGKYIEEK